MSDRDVSFTEMVKGVTEKESGPEYSMKEFPASIIVKSVDRGNKQISAIASGPSLDRDEEIILPSAFKELLPVYMKNPVVLASHQHRLSDGHSPVVGNVTKAWVDKNGLHVDIRFAETELGEEYWTLYSNKWQRAFSVGYIPLEWEDKQDEKLGRVRVFSKVELLEISCVAVPSNRDALTRSKQRKYNFVQAKKELRQEERILAELRAEDPDFDKKCDEFGDMILGVTQEQGDLDFAGLVRGRPI